MLPHYLKSRKSGFSLIQVSILLTMASLVMVATLPSYQTKLTSNKNSTNKLNSVMSAVRDFQLANGRLPCPADAGIMIGSTNYGVEAGNQNSNCTGSTPSANLQSNNVAIGMIPVKTLGLPNDAVLDDFGRYITYGVDTTATGCWASQSLPGKIIIDDPDYSPSSGKAFAKNTVIALVSHGADGYGAFLPAVSGGTVNRFNAASSDTDEALNAHVTPATVTSTGSTQGTDSNSVTATFVSKNPTSGFDDLVVYGSKTWNINTAPNALTSATIVTSKPTNGTYNSASPPLTFTLTTPQPVTVTAGTLPRLAITAITNAANPSAKVGSTVVNGISTGYATYTGVTGTSTTLLTFSYTIAASDSAPVGIALLSPIDMNGGGAFISPCFTFFTPPDLSQVLIVQNSLLWAVNFGTTNQVQSFSASDASFKGNLASSLGTTVFVGVTVDSSGNVWLALQNPPNITEYTASGGSAITTFSYGSGQVGLTVDKYNNIWASNGDASVCGVFGYGQNGTSYVSIGGSGSCSSYPTDVNQQGQLAFDHNGNLWIADNGNKRITGYSVTYDASHHPSSLSLIAQTTACTSTNLTSPFSVAVDANNVIWLGDASLNKIFKYTYSGGTLTCGGSYGTAGTAAGQINAPYYMAIDANNHLWIAEETNQRIDEYDTSSGSLTYLSHSTSVGTLTTMMGIATIPPTSR